MDVEVSISTCYSKIYHLTRLVPLSWRKQLKCIIVKSQAMLVTSMDKNIGLDVSGLGVFEED